jgi:hypothetical protein
MFSGAMSPRTGKLPWGPERIAFVLVPGIFKTLTTKATASSKPEKRKLHLELARYYRRLLLAFADRPAALINV